MRPTLTGMEQVLADAGGPDAPRERIGQLRRMLGQELQHGVAELAQPRSGYEHPIVVAAAAHPGGGLVAVVPVAPELRADPDVADERSWLLTAATIGALSDAAGGARELRAGVLDDRLALHVTGAGVGPQRSIAEAMWTTFSGRMGRRTPASASTLTACAVLPTRSRTCCTWDIDGEYVTWRPRVVRLRT